LDFAHLWGLDPSIDYLNHGSFGACPSAVLALQSQLRLELEREPVDFLVGTLAARLQQTRTELAAFLVADPQDLVFVPNATTGVNTVLRSLSFAAGDELLLTNHTYAACRKAVEFIAATTGLRIVVATLPFPVRDETQIIDSILTCASPRTRLALLDHVTSPTALVMPLGRLIAELQLRGIDTLVDGAHAPGMVPIDLTQLGAAYYTGNAHKWLCAPKGAAFLHVRRDRQQRLHPLTISHGHRGGFQAEFDWTGTVDPTPWLCIGQSLRYLQGLLPGGWNELMQRNRALALEARTLLLRTLQLEPPCPEGMIGSMAAIPLPPATAGAPAHGLDAQQMHDWFRKQNVETWLYPEPLLLLRVSAQLYNHIGQFRHLADLLQEALHGRSPRNPAPA
jgi:isopenicillin-N epimerase